nr:reverse transcriptase domain-containing protein [Tanacetum cinerariifolium]
MIDKKTPPTRRVHFVNTITLVKKERESRNTTVREHEGLTSEVDDEVGSNEFEEEEEDDLCHTPSGYFYFFRRISRECGILFFVSYPYRFYFVEVPVAPEVGAAAVVSPAGVLELDTHSSSEADPSESSPPPVSVAPMVSPFLCSNDSGSDTEMPERHADATAVEVVVDRDVMTRVDAGIGMEVDVRIDIEDGVENEDESSDRGAMEVRVDLVAEIDIPDGMLIPDAVERLEQARSLIADGERASLLEQVASLERINARLQGTVMMKSARADRFRRYMSFIESELRQIHRFRYYDMMRFRRLEKFVTRRLEAIKEIVNQQVEEALAAYEATRAANALEAKTQSQNGNDDDNEIGGNRNGGNENGGNGNGGNGNPNENDRSARPVAREYTYQDFMKCQPLNFKGTRGVISVLLKNEIQKMESELWNLTVKNNDLAAYTQRFQELTMLCTKMVPEEEDRGYGNKFGHMARDCKNAVAIPATHIAPVVNQRVPTCFECGRQGHYRNECPKLKSQNRGNKAGKKTKEARGKAYVLGGGEANLNSNVVTESGSRFDTAYPKDWIRRIRVSWSRDHI